MDNLPKEKIEEAAEEAGIPVDKAEESINKVVDMIQDPDNIPKEDKSMAKKMITEAVAEENDFEEAKKVVGTVLSSNAGAQKAGKISGEGLAAVAELGDRINKGTANMGDFQKVSQYLMGAIDGYNNARELSNEVYNAIEDVKKKDVIDVDEKDQEEDSD